MILKNIFPENPICTIFKRNRNLKEMLSHSLYTKIKMKKKFYREKPVENVTFVKIYLISDSTFTCLVISIVIICMLYI